MADKTKIQWTDASWNPVRGCSRVSDGCRHCYAERVAARFSGPGQPYEGLARMASRGHPDVIGSTDPIREPRWTGEVRMVPEQLDQPLRWKRPRRVFVASMSDLFHEDVPDEFIDRVWAVMLLSPRHTFQLLTKRPERMRAYLTAPGLYDRVLRAAGVIRVERPELMGVGISNPATHPRPWIWLGVSVEDQQRADERIPLLLKTPAAVRFVSAEPLLGPVNVAHVRVGRPDSLYRANALTGDGFDGTGLDWIIVGGESGPGARPCDVAWIRSIVEQCRDARVACFVKQLGAHRIEDGCHDPGHTSALDRVRSRKGDDPAEWPEDLRVQEFPTGGAA